MMRKLILIIISCFLLLFVSIGVNAIHISQTPISTDSEAISGPPNNNEKEIYLEPKYDFNLFYANANGPYYGTVNEPVKFFCSGTNIPDPKIFLWEFDDNNDKRIKEGMNPIHIYSEPGVYYVTLTVETEKDVYKDIAPVYIDCDGDHLRPYGGCLYNAKVNEYITFDASDSYSTESEIIQYHWDFGDGSDAYGKCVSHKYTEERVYLVTLEVTDNNGLTSHDVLHADIGISFSDEEDFFFNAPKEFKGILDLLLNRNDLQVNVFNNLLDTKIYTNFNGVEKWTELSGLSPLPVEIDVNGNGINDVRVNDIKYFDAKKGPSLFDSNSRIWYQFETTVSDVKKISEDITVEDELTVCLQLDFGFIADKLELEDNIIRVGYFSPTGEEMPESISLTHILRPYILFRMLGLDKDRPKDVVNEIFHMNKKDPASVKNESIQINNDLYSTGKNETVFDIKNPFKDTDVIIDKTNNNKQLNGKYMPEYGIRISSSGGGDFSLFSMVLNSAGSSKTTMKISYGSSTSSFIYKRSRTLGIINHAAVFEIPGEDAKLSIIRQRNSEISEMSTGFSYSSQLLRGIGWSDEGFSAYIDGNTKVRVYDFYFENPRCKLVFDNISLEANGNLDFDLKQDAKLEMDGNGGFVLEDLSFDIKSSGLKMEIIGIFSMDLDGFVHLGLGLNLFEIGFNGNLELESDCEFKANGESVVTRGNFYLENDGIIAFSWGNNKFNIDLDEGFLLNVENLVFQVGDLNASASSIEIGASGKFSVTWDTSVSEVTISGGPDSQLGIQDVEIDYGTSLNVKVIGSFNVAANGYITFGPNVFKAGFDGILDLGSSCEFEINGEGLSVGGVFEMIGGDGEISFNWDEDEFSLDIFGGPELDVSDLYFKIGDLTVSAEEIKVGANGQFNIIWDIDNNEVTINGGSSALLALTDIDITFESSLEIKIIGSLELQADGYITFSPDTFIAGFSGTLDLGLLCEFEINGERIKIGGVYTLTSGNGEIGFVWSDDEFNLYVSGSPELIVTDLFFEVGDIKIISKYVGICASGDFTVEWDVSISEITISSGIDSSLEIEDFSINYGTILDVDIVGFFDIQAEGYITFAPGVFKAGFTGTLDFGTSCEFIINGDSISVGGMFSLSGGNGEIEFNWDDDQFSLFVSGGPSLEVSDLFFEAGELTINAESVEIGIGGQFNIDMDIPKSEIKISSGGGVSLQLSDLEVTLGSSLDISIVGTFEIQANGYIVFAPGTFKANFQGVLNLGTGGSYCEFIINDESIKIGGEFSLSTGNGEISFEWSDNNFVLDVEGSPELSVSDLYFEAGDLKVKADYVDIGADGQFNLDLNTATSEVTISGSAGISLEIENVEITIGTTLDVKIIGSFNIQAGGYITFGPGIFKAGFDGSLDLGLQTQFEINGDSITVGGLYSLIGGDGEVSFSWDIDAFSLEVSGGPRLNVDDFYFEAEIDNEDLLITIDYIEIGINGDLTMEWFSQDSKIKINSDAGSSLFISEVSIIYGSTIDIKIIGSLDISVDGSISLSPGNFQASFSGSIILSPGFGFEINGESISISGQFSIPSGFGDTVVSWNDEELSFQASGGIEMNVKYLLFETDALKFDIDSVGLGLNGELSFKFDDSLEKFEIDSNVGFLLVDLTMDVYLNDQWNTVASLQRFEIGGGGYLLLDSGTDSKIVADFSVNLKINDLNISPPDDWNCGLSIGSSDIVGDGIIDLEESTIGEGVFDISGSVTTGLISSFNAYIMLSGSNFEIGFSNLEFGGELSIKIDDIFHFIAGGVAKFNDFSAIFGSFNIESDINIVGGGIFEGIWSNDQIELNLDVNFNWNIFLDSPTIGVWETHGNLVGAIELFGEWTEDSGSIDITVDTPGILHSFSIVHDSLNLSLGEFSISPGPIIFEWDKNDYIDQGYFYINSGISVNIDVVGISWDTKSVSLGILDVEPGEFKFEWDEPSKILAIKNGMDNFGPSISYTDTSEELEIIVSVTGLISDYSKTITLQWYEDNGQIIGIYVDTSNSNLAEFLQIGVIRDVTGKRVALYGLQCDAFYIIKENGEFKWGGKIYVANHIKFSKLIDGEWKDLDVRWNLVQQNKWIKFVRDPDFDLKIKLFNTEIFGFSFSSEINLMQSTLLELRWDIDVTGSVFIDTNWEYLSSINFLIGPNYGIGLNVTVYGLRAENWRVEWTAWPPEEWNVVTHGSLDAGGIEVEFYYDGDWHHLWPW